MSFIARVKRLMTPKSETIFQRTRLNLLRVEPVSMRNVWSFDMALVRLHPLEVPVTTYTKLLDRVAGAIIDDKQLSPMQLPQAVLEIYLRDFFQDANGNFVNPVTATKEFTDSCIRFVDVYEEKERVAEKSFTLERNLRLTQGLLSNIAVVAEELINGGGTQK